MRPRVVVRPLDHQASAANAQTPSATTATTTMATLRSPELVLCSTLGSARKFQA